MKKQIFLIIIISLCLSVSCQGTGATVFSPEKPTLTKTVTTSLDSSPTQLITTTMIYPAPNASETSATTSFSTVKPTSTPNITQTAQSNGSLNIQCLQILPIFTADIGSSGIIVLGTRAGGEQRRYDSLILNMDSGERSEFTTPKEFQVENVVSPDRKLMAYKSVVFVNPNTLPEYELVIANADGSRLKTIAWEDKWLDILDWTIDQRLLLSYDEPYLTSDGKEIPISYLVLDPLTDEQELLQPDIPGFLKTKPPFPWLFWSSLIVDPTLTRVIYPQLMPDNEEEYTLILWDETTKKQVTGLENIYLESVGFSQTTSMPRWSADGTQFAFRGQILASEDLVKFELYRVSRDGDNTEQLTNLTSRAEIEPSRFSWSPDGKHIAILVDTWYTHGNTHLAVIDVNTHVVTDYCVPVRGLQYGAPIWSPDGTQLLVMDETDGNRRVILVDIVENFAAQIAENYDPLGWMVSP